MTQRVVVLGAGPGGYVAAVRAAQLGAEVTVVEAHKVGGTCLNYGCIPSKILKKTADMLEEFHKAKAFGINVSGEATCDMEGLMARKEQVVGSQSKGILGLLKKHGIRYVEGTARIAKPGLAVVTDEANETEEIAWDKLILATGSRPLSIPTFPTDGRDIISSDEVVALQSVPESITIVGGGVIGCEFAFILDALGAKVTLVEGLDRVLPLPSVDEECSKVLLREMKKRKIKVLVNRTVESVTKAEGRLNVTIGPSPFAKNLKEKDRQPVYESADKVLVCIGRKPNTDGLGLEEIGVKLDQRGWVIADEKMQTAARNVYAIGDVLGPAKVMLAHVASTEGEIAAENIMGASKTMRYDVIPGAIFTMPEVANVGLSETQAKETNENIRADSVLFRTLGKAQVIGEIAGFAKIISDKASGKILGAHIVGPHATDLIAEATLAIRTGATVKALSETIHAHPTLAEVMLEVSFKALDLPLHG